MSYSTTYHEQGRYSRNDIQSLMKRSSSSYYKSEIKPLHFPRKNVDHIYNVRNNGEVADPASKRRKFSGSTWENSRVHYPQYNTVDSAPSTSTSLLSTTTRSKESYGITGSKRGRESYEDDVVFMSRDDIERLSPSRKDGIDPLRETYLRYSYCAFLQNLGMQLELPQTTIGTAMVLCHRFFVRCSHASHDRFYMYIPVIVTKNRLTRSESVPYSFQKHQHPPPHHLHCHQHPLPHLATTTIKIYFFVQTYPNIIWHSVEQPVIPQIGEIRFRSG
ncbi:hypothetical protein ACHQM5_014427 [Ranunculus cassubicifolius]